MNWESVLPEHFLRIVVTVTCSADVQVSKSCLPSRETLLDRLCSQVKIVVYQSDGCAQRDSVDHDLILTQLFVFSELLESVDQEVHVWYWEEFDVISSEGFRLQLEAGVIDYAAPRADLMTVTPMRWMNFAEVSEHRFPIQGNQKVYPVNMGSELLRIDPQSVVAVLTLDVGVIFNIGEHV